MYNLTLESVLVNLSGIEIGMSRRVNCLWFFVAFSKHYSKPYYQLNTNCLPFLIYEKKENSANSKENVDGSYHNGCVSCWDSSLDFQGRGPTGLTREQGRMRAERGWRLRRWGSAGDSETCTHWLRHHNRPTLPFADSPVLLCTPVTQQTHIVIIEMTS